MHSESKEDTDHGWQESIKLAIENGQYEFALSRVNARIMGKALEALKEHSVEIDEKTSEMKNADEIYDAINRMRQTNEEVRRYTDDHYTNAAALAVGQASIMIDALHWKFSRRPIALAEYRAKLLLAGWVAGLASAEMAITLGDVFRKAHLADEYISKRVAGGRNSAKEKNLWHPAAKQVAEDWCAHCPSTSSREIAEKIDEAKVNAPHYEQVVKVVRKWRRDGMLPKKTRKRL